MERNETERKEAAPGNHKKGDESSGAALRRGESKKVLKNRRAKEVLKVDPRS